MKRKPNGDDGMALGGLLHLEPDRDGTGMRVTDPGLQRAVRDLPAPPAPAVGGTTREVSVVMADLRGFTSFCERMPPGRISRVLNDYLTAMVDVIMDHRGYVQDFIGDGILGVFGAPLDDPDHVWHATLTALAMQAAILRLSAVWERETGDGFALGVAVHTGEAFAGVVGSPRQRKYAVVGDTVNTVSRLEELNRELDTAILVSGTVLELVSARVETRPKGVFALRGRCRAMEVFELLGLHPSLAARRRALAAGLGSTVRNGDRSDPRAPDLGACASE